MDQNLQEVEKVLISLEEMLLFELDKARNKLKDELYIPLKENRYKRFVQIYKRIYKRLMPGDGIAQLALVSELEDQLQGRLGVLRILLENKIPSAYVEVAHQDILHSRIRLEKRVYARRSERKQSVKAVSSDASQAEERVVSSREASLNYMDVTDEEARELEDVRTSGDTAIYSAARELKMLSAYVRFHKNKTPPAPRGRAHFVSKELRYNAQNDVKAHLANVKKNKDASVAKAVPEKKDKKEEREKPKDIAQTPEEIRKKLEARGGKIIGSGPSVFESRDIYSESEEFSDKPVANRKPQPKPQPQPKPPPLPERDPNEPIAQTPEEIRKKLEQRKIDTKEKGKAVFESRDLSS